LNSVISKLLIIVLLTTSILSFIPNSVTAVYPSENENQAFQVDSEESDAEIRNIEFTDPITIESIFTINITVRNYDCGSLGADLVVILKQNSVEFSRQNAFVFRILRQSKTFVFSFTANKSPGIMDISVELYWNNRDSMELQDSKNIQLQIVAIEPTPTPTPTPTATPTPTPIFKIDFKRFPNWCDIIFFC